MEDHMISTGPQHGTAHLVVATCGKQVLHVVDLQAAGSRQVRACANKRTSQPQLLKVIQFYKML